MKAATYLARAAWAAAACFVVLGGARAHASTIPGAADRILALVNQQRTSAGLRPLTMDSQLNAAAQNYAEAMGAGGFYAHNGPDGSTPLSRMNAAGFPGTGSWGENIAAGQSDADSVMQAWMNSPGHRENIMNPSFTQIGIGAANVPGSQWQNYWVQDFGIRAGGSGAGTGGGSVTPQPAPTPQPTPTPTPTPQPAPQPTPAPQPQPQALPPSLSYVTPTRGAVGDTVTLVGQRFGSVAGTVSFSGTPARILRWSDSRIDVQVPAGAASGAIYVQNAVGTSGGVNFTVTVSAPQPAPTTVTPQASYLYPAKASPGARVTIYGKNFGTTAGHVAVNGVPAQIAFWYDTIISFTVPNGATTGPVLVQASGGAVVAGTLTVTAATPTPTPAPAPTPTPNPPSGGTGSGNGSSVTPPTPVTTPIPTPHPTAPVPHAKPVIRSVNVVNGAISRTVTINGSGFGAQTGKVRIGSTLVNVVSWSDTSITIEVPLRTRGKAKKVKLDLIRPDGGRSKKIKVRL